jgi:hypothetical protein
MSYSYWDYIPGKDSELAAWSANFTAAVAANASTWGIPSAEVTDLQNANDSFALLYEQANSPAKNAIIVAQKNAARKELEAKIRGLVRFRLKNPIITNAHRVALGLRIHDATKSKIPAPTSRPELSFGVVDVRRVQVSFRDMGRSSKAKPCGVSGAVIAYSVLDVHPASPDALVHFVLATRTPHVFEFTEAERGKTLYVAICWQNQRGQKGPWSEIESAIIP